MTTFNRLYRAPKFHLCIHTGNEDHIDFVWKGRLLEQNETQISSKHQTSVIVCFKGTFVISGKEVPELAYVELKPNKIYNIDSSNSFVGIFEEGYA